MTMPFSAPQWAKWTFVPIGLLSFYVLFLALVLHPTFQAHNVFLHSINIPFHHPLSDPDRVRGIAKGKARNFRIVASDGVQIAGWHILPDKLEAPQNLHGFDDALIGSPVVLCASDFHGNAMNRAAPIRIGAYNQLTSLGMNVVAIDYRGFGDSEGQPTEEGVLRDARAAYRWIVERQQGAARLSRGERLDEITDDVFAGQILLSGQSLGTGVASRLTLDLVEAGRPPMAVLLLAPYISIRELLSAYRFGGIFPLFWPLSFSALANLADKYLYTRFESDKALYVTARGGFDALDDEEQIKFGHLDHTLPREELRKELGLDSSSDDQTDYRSASLRHASSNIRTHIIIAHADDDAIIPHTQGRGLFDRVHDALAYELRRKRHEQQHGEQPEDHFATETDDRLSQQLHTRDHPWGTLLTVSPKAGQPARLTLFKSRKGGHNGVPRHALEYFVNIATGQTPATAAGSAEAETASA